MRLVQNLCEAGEQKSRLIPRKGAHFSIKHPLPPQSLYAVAFARFKYRTQTCRQQQRRKKIVVRFATAPPTVHAYHSVDRSELQYTRDDYQKFEQDVCQTLQAYHSNHSFAIDETHGTTITGLEHYLDAEQIVRRKRCIQTYKNLLLQYQTTVTAQQLRTVSEQWTRRTVQRAQFRALLDAALLRQ